MIYKAGKRTGVENNKFINFNLSAATYSIDDLMPKLMCESNNKGKTGNHLNLNI